MSPHDRGVDQAMRYLRGEILYVEQLMSTYRISRATAKRDLAGLRRAIHAASPKHGVREVLSARLVAPLGASA